MQVPVKTFAALMSMPAHEQLGEIGRLKRSRREGVYYGVTYYAPARRAITAYFNQNRDIKVLDKEIQRLTQQKNPNHRVRNNIRAIEAFREGQMSDHPFELKRIKRLSWEVEGLTIGCRPDLVLREGEQDTYVFLNFTKEDLPEETVRLTLELTHHILADQGIEVPFRRLQYVFLEKDVVRSWMNPRVRTLDRAIATARVIAHLWDLA